MKCCTVLMETTSLSISIIRSEVDSILQVSSLICLAESCHVVHPSSVICPCIPRDTALPQGHLHADAREMRKCRKRDISTRIDIFTIFHGEFHALAEGSMIAQHTCTVFVRAPHSPPLGIAPHDSRVSPRP